MGKSNGIYRAKIYRCGAYMDFYGYPVFPIPLSCRTGKRIRKKPTRKMQEKLNWRHAAEKLTRILNTNFTEEDLSLTLTFRENPIDDEAAKKAIQKFLRKIRYRFRKLERELKYIWQLEKSKKGRYHIHMVLSGGIDGTHWKNYGEMGTPIPSACNLTKMDWRHYPDTSGNPALIPKRNG